MVNLTSEGGDSPWAAMVQMPSGMTPGDQSLLVIAKMAWAPQANNESTLLQTALAMLCLGRIMSVKTFVYRLR